MELKNSIDGILELKK